MTGSGESVFVIDRSAEAFTVVVAVALLLAVFPSKVDEAALAVFVRTVPSGVLGFTVPVTVMVALPLAAIVPRLQGKAVQPPCDELTVTPVRSTGSLSPTLTARASEGPA